MDKEEGLLILLTILLIKLCASSIIKTLLEKGLIVKLLVSDARWLFLRPL